jgi:3-deoxy-D-manno-octulosonic-acid transferase
MLLLYNLALALYHAGIRLAALWNPKAALWVNGRRQWPARLKEALNGQGYPRIWMHCASLGEFEQGRPVLEALRREYPGARIILSFFSPSGYEIRKHYPGADLVCYLPMDSASNARAFLDAVDPGLAIFIKYEFWHHYLQGLKKRGTPTLLVSAIFRPGQPFFRPWGGFWRGMLSSYTRVFVQDDASARLLDGIGFGAVTTVSGDTRFDRVIAVAESGEDIPAVRAFCGNHRVVVAGSTWPEDEEVIAHYARSRPGTRFIIAPHEIHASHLRDIEKIYPHSIRFSALPAAEATTVPPDGVQVLLMDNMGMLSRLYRYADITYVGGGFGGAGIHNILEAAVYGKPVIFGPVHEKSREALQLLEAGGAFTVQSAIEFESLADELFEAPALLEKSGNICSDYVRQESGATKTILGYIQEKRLLTS